MRILALDQAQHCGFAIGLAGQIERSGTVILKKKAEPPAVAWENMGLFLRDTFTFEKPDLIAIEAALHPVAQRSGEATIVSWGLVAVVHFIAKAYGIRIERCHEATVKKHFTGKGRYGSSQEGKDAVIARAIQLGFLPKGSRDEDRADAIAIHDFASWKWGRVAPKPLGELLLPSPEPEAPEAPLLIGYTPEAAE